MADPLNYYSKLLKTVSNKRAKTEADHHEMARIEWYGGLYLHQGAICVPGMCLEAMIVKAAKKQRKGQETTAGVYVEGFFPLLYEGPQSPEVLWDDTRFRHQIGVVVKRNRVVRTRPMFPEWGCTFAVTLNDSLVNPAEVTAFLRYAGENVGLGDWRPKYGRFTLEE